MKKVVNIDPELEYENAKKLIEIASQSMLSSGEASNLDSCVDNLATAVRVLLERENIRRGKIHPPKKNKEKNKKEKKVEERSDLKKLPSQRFPNLEIKEEIVRLASPPTCSCCQKQMKESGLFDTSEKLEVVPKSYYILRKKRVKYNVNHHLITPSLNNKFLAN